MEEKPTNRQVRYSLFNGEGYTYGAPDNKKFVVFIDDVNATNVDRNELARCDEVIFKVPMSLVV